MNVTPTSVELPGHALRCTTWWVLNHLVTKVCISNNTGPSIGDGALNLTGGNGPLTIAAQP